MNWMIPTIVNVTKNRKVWMTSLKSSVGALVSLVSLEKPDQMEGSSFGHAKKKLSTHQSAGKVPSCVAWNSDTIAVKRKTVKFLWFFYLLLLALMSPDKHLWEALYWKARQQPRYGTTSLIYISFLNLNFSERDDFLYSKKGFSRAAGL